MIKHLYNNKIDYQKWDECITKSFNGNIYAFSWYLDIVCEKWEALIEDDYTRVFPLISRKKFNINYLYQPFFAQQHGIFSSKILTKDIVENFINSIPNQYKFGEINLNSYNKIPKEKFKSIPNKNFELDLIKPYNTIVKGYSTNLKRNIKKAEKNKLTLLKNINPDSTIQMFKENKGVSIKNFSEKEYKTINLLIRTCIHKNIGESWGIFTAENTLCAGAFFVKSHKKSIFLFSATSAIGKSNGAMSLLIDTYIKSHSQQETTLDFEGSNDTNLARFYAGFGAKECHYFQLLINNLPYIIKKVVKFVKWIKR